MKSIEQMHNEKQKRIKEAIKNKETRQTKTEISIGFRWSINCAISFLPEKLKGTIEGFKQVKKWQSEFESWDREFMIENMPKPKEYFDPKTPKNIYAAMEVADPEDIFPVVENDKEIK